MNKEYEKKAKEYEERFSEQQKANEVKYTEDIAKLKAGFQTELTQLKAALDKTTYEK